MTSQILTSRLFDTLVRHLPPLVVSLGLAEAFFRFGSFTLECLAFLAVWHVMNAGYAKLLSNSRRP